MVHTPIIILVEPQLAENIGAVARAMGNCNLNKLRLVKPRDGWPNQSAYAMASGADPILDYADVFSTLEHALADLNYVYATTARHREMVRLTYTPHAAARDMYNLTQNNQKIGIVFGPERTGLSNDHVSLCHATISVPLNPKFSSLNLAQAVLLVGYEWYQISHTTLEHELVTNKTSLAEHKEVLNFFIYLEKQLIDKGFLENQQKRSLMIRNIRNIFQRSNLTEQDVSTLYGIVKFLSEDKKQ
ncbi:MAG: RNA methyltransferase [Alphaproteobacteria bacterium]|nr:RNA methyltransferase [Alphaproteobacteria bacterium]